MRAMRVTRAVSAFGSALASAGLLLAALCPGVTVGSVTVATLPGPASPTPVERTCQPEGRPTCCPERTAPASSAPCGGGACRVVVNPGTQAVETLKVARGEDSVLTSARSADLELRETGARRPRPAVEGSPPVYLLGRSFRN